MVDTKPPPAHCVAGTYDGGIVGWDVTFDDDDDSTSKGELKMVSLSSSPSSFH